LEAPLTGRGNSLSHIKPGEVFSFFLLLLLLTKARKLRNLVEIGLPGSSFQDVALVRKGSGLGFGPVD